MPKGDNHKRNADCRIRGGGDNVRFVIQSFPSSPNYFEIIARIILGMIVAEGKTLMIMILNSSSY